MHPTRSGLSDCWPHRLRWQTEGPGRGCGLRTEHRGGRCAGCPAHPRARGREGGWVAGSSRARDVRPWWPAARGRIHTLDAASFEKSRRLPAVKARPSQCGHCRRADEVEEAQHHSPWPDAPTPVPVTAPTARVSGNEQAVARSQAAIPGGRPVTGQQVDRPAGRAGNSRAEQTRGRQRLSSPRPVTLGQQSLKMEH